MVHGDPAYWKEAYKDGQWKGGVRRVKAVLEALQAKGIKVAPFADDALSEEYIDNTAHEKGESDLKITKESNAEVLLEVTGPEIKIPETSALWFRPDKFDYAVNHSDKEVWGAHILEYSKLIRFVKFSKEIKDKYPIVTPLIRGRTERFVEIPANSEDIISFEKFCEHVKNG